MECIMSGLFYGHQRGSTPFKNYYQGHAVIGQTSGHGFFIGAIGLDHDTLVAASYPSGEGGTIDEIVIWNCSTVATAKVRLGIYESDLATGYPTNLVTGSAVELVVDTFSGAGLGDLTI